MTVQPPCVGGAQDIRLSGGRAYLLRRRLLRLRIRRAKGVYKILVLTSRCDHNRSN
jgi:hypothetical protein